MDRHQNKDGEPETDESAKKNVEAFLSAHIIPVRLLGPLRRRQADYVCQGSVELPCGGGVETLAGTTVEIVEDEEKEGGWRAKPGDIEVLGVKDVSPLSED